MRLMHKVGLCGILPLFLGGCAVGQKFAMHTAKPDLGYQGSASVSVAVLDQRAHVLKGMAKPSRVGNLRGGFGNVFEVTTASGSSLAEDAAAVLVDGLGRAGFKATRAQTSLGQPEKEALAALKATNPQRQLLLLISEWKSDTMYKTAVYFDLVLKVFDASGRELAVERAQGKEDLPVKGMDSLKKGVPEVFAGKLEVLLKADKVRKALDKR